MTSSIETTWQDELHGKFDAGDLVTARGPDEPGMEVLGDGGVGLVVEVMVPGWGGETIPRVVKIMWPDSEIENVYEDELVSVEL